MTQIPPGQAALPPNPVPPASVLGQAPRAEAVEPARQVTAIKNGSETSSKSRSKTGQDETTLEHTSQQRRSRPRGSLIDVTV